MSVLLPAIVSIGLISLIGFAAGKTLLGLLLMYRTAEVFRSGYLKAALFDQVTQRPEA